MCIISSLPKYTGLCSPTSGNAPGCSSAAYRRSHSPSSSPECVFDGSFSGAYRRSHSPSSSPECVFDGSFSGACRRNRSPSSSPEYVFDGNPLRTCLEQCRQKVTCTRPVVWRMSDSGHSKEPDMWVRDQQTHGRTKANECECVCNCISGRCGNHGG
jgi:hypothetical protein